MPLDRPAVLRAALALADAEGVEAVTMRRLATALGVTPMALYNHVRSRTDLLDGVADLVAGAIEAPPRSLPWDGRLRVLLRATRAVCLRHPAVVPLLQGAGALTPNLLRPAEAALDALAEAGLEPEDARAAWAALIGLTFGHVAYQLAGHLRGSGGARGTPDAAAFPRVAALADSPPLDWDAAFEHALDALLGGLAPGRA